MSPEVEKTMKRSSHDFLTLAWPRISFACGGGDLYPTETVTESRFLKIFDTSCGIDAWQIVRQKGIELCRGIASRVQWVRGDIFRTFTIRYNLPSGRPTEWHKRVHAHKHPEDGWLSPHYTAQAYVSTDSTKIYSVAAIPEDNLFEYALEHEAELVQNARTNPADGVTFLYVNWEQLLDRGIILWAPNAKHPLIATDQTREDLMRTTAPAIQLELALP